MNIAVPMNVPMNEFIGCYPKRVETRSKGNLFYWGARLPKFAKIR